MRLVGNVSLKGMENVEVGEIVAFSAGETESAAVESGESLVALLRQDFHQRQQPVAPFTGAFDEGERHDTTTEHQITSELVICMRKEPNLENDDVVVIGEWDPRSDDVHRPLRLPRGDFQRLFELKGDPIAGMLSLTRESVRHIYDRLAEDGFMPAFQLATYRTNDEYVTYVVGEAVEQL
jgi:hypothetical protein